MYNFNSFNNNILLQFSSFVCKFDFIVTLVNPCHYCISPDKKMKERTPPPRDALYMECLAHAEVVNERCRRFYGRERELKSIRKYLDDTRSSSALMLCGQSGCGKTAIMAKAASMEYKKL